MRRRDAKGLALAVAAGVSWALALPGVGLAPLILLTPGLLRRAVAGVGHRRALLLGWTAGFVEWLIAVPWVYIVLHRFGHLAAPLAVLAVVLMAAILAWTWGLAVWASSWVRDSWRPWVIPVALVAAEVAQGNPPWTFPWNPAAAVLTPWPILLRPAAVIGTVGVSWLLVSTGGALDALLERRVRGTAIAMACAVAVVGGATAVIAPPFAGNGRTIRAAAVQPNVPLEERWAAENSGEIERRVWRLSTQAVESGARWVVWPESAIPRIVERDGPYRAAIERFAREHDIWMIVGSIGFGAGETYYNSAYSVAPAGFTPFRFDKVHLVPFGEYVPVVGTLPFLRPLVREVGGFTPGRRLIPLPGPVGPVGVAICYEIAFPSLFRDEVMRGAEVLTTITNDGWYGDSAAPRQHLAFSVLRAAESRRWLVRAANTGISAIIDPYGRVVKRLGFGRAGVIEDQVEGSAAVTPATRAEPILQIAPVIVFLGVILASIRHRQRSLAPRGGST